MQIEFRKFVPISGKFFCTKPSFSEPSFSVQKNVSQNSFVPG